MDAFGLLCRMEGIIPAIESARTVAGALKLGVESLGKGALIVLLEPVGTWRQRCPRHGRENGLACWATTDGGGGTEQ